MASRSKFGLRVLKVAQKELAANVQEVPLGSNWGPRVKTYLAAAGITFPAAWCAAFMTWCCAQAGKTITFTGPALVQDWDNFAAANGEVVTRPFAGDFVTFDWNGDKWFDHIGIVEKVLAIRPFGVFWFRTIEGNSSDRVKRNWHWSNAQGTRFLQFRDDSPA